MGSWKGEDLKNGHVIDAVERYIACRRIMREMDF